MILSWSSRRAPCFRGALTLQGENSSDQTAEQGERAGSQRLGAAGRDGRGTSGGRGAASRGGSRAGSSAGEGQDGMGASGVGGGVVARSRQDGISGAGRLGLVYTVSRRRGRRVRGRVDRRAAVGGAGSGARTGLDVEGERVLEDGLVRVKGDLDAVRDILAQGRINGPRERASRVGDATCTMLMLGARRSRESGVRLTLDGCDGLESRWRSATQQGEGDGARVGLAGLPDDVEGRASGNALVLGGVGDGVEAGSLGQDGAGEGHQGSSRDGEAHLDWCVCETDEGTRKKFERPEG